MAIDAGTANTVIYVPGEGIVLNEPSVVAVEITNGIQRVRAVGSDAKILIGKTADNIRTYRPLVEGVIKDLELTEAMIKHFIAKAMGGRSLISRGPEVVIGVPSASTEVERRAIQAAAINAGAREVWLIEEPVAAAIGAGLPVAEPVGSMVVLTSAAARPKSELLRSSAPPTAFRNGLAATNWTTQSPHMSDEA